MKGNKPDIWGYPSKTTTQSISVSNGYGSHTTSTIEGEIKRLIVTPPVKTNTETIDTSKGSLTINITS